MIASLACTLPLGDASDIVDTAVETAEAVGQEAGGVAQTAAAQAGDFGATAAAKATGEGGNLLSTVLAAGTPAADAK